MASICLGLNVLIFFRDVLITFSQFASFLWCQKSYKIEKKRPRGVHLTHIQLKCKYNTKHNIIVHFYYVIV